VEPAVSAGGLAPWLQGGGSAAAVAGLVYVARMIVRGDLVPRSVEAREREVTEAVRVAFVREEKLLEALGESASALSGYAKVLNESNRLLGRATQIVEKGERR